jgi:hypothetical protein
MAPALNTGQLILPIPLGGKCDARPDLWGLTEGERLII